MMSDKEIRAAPDAREIILDPFDPTKLEPASNDSRVGTRAFASSSKEKVNLGQKGVLVIDPGEFAVLETRERVRGKAVSVQGIFKSWWKRRA
jgi:deoxycytidine triphosphate deaminase